MENQGLNRKVNPGTLCQEMTKLGNMFDHVNETFDILTEDMRIIFRDPNLSLHDKQSVYDCYNYMYISWRDSCRLGPPPMDFPPLKDFMEAMIERVGGGDYKISKSKNKSKSKKNTRKSPK